MPLARALFHESSEIKKLTIYDFDDTLVKTKSMVYVTNTKTGKRRALTPGQYAIYTPKPNDEFDYSEFEGVNNAEEIKTVTDGLRKVAKARSGHNVFILTARGSYKPIKDYLGDIGVNTNQVFVVALGSSDPMDKANWIEDMIDKHGYNDIYFIDDSIKNIRAVKRMLQDKQKTNPDIKFKVRHFTH